jgi:hypothetical protein
MGEISMTTYECPMSDESFEKLIEPSHFAAGQSRQVYRVVSDPAVIVKRVKNLFPGPNIVEWTTWHAIQDTELEHLFAKCLTISCSGRYLMMEHLDDTTTADDNLFPAFPDWLTDRKRSAFGRDAQGTIKVRDYGTLKLGYTLQEAPRFKLSFK